MERKTELKTSKMLAYLLCLVYIVSYIARHNYSAALVKIIDSGLFSKAEAGIIGTVYFTVYGSGQIIFGYIADRVSPYKLITAGLFGTAVSNFLMTLCSTVPQMTVIWALNGVSQSVLWPGIFYLISNLMAEEYRSRACLVMSVSVPIGTMSAYFLAGSAIKISWQTAFLYPSFIAFAMGIVFISASFYFRKNLKPKPDEIKEKEANLLPGAYKKALFSSGAFIIMIPVFLHGMLRDGVNAWVPTMIKETYLVSPSFSVFVSVVLPVINLSGAYISMFFFNKLTKKNEVASAFISLALGIIPMIILLFLKRINMFTSVLSLALATTFISAFNHMIVTMLPLRFARFNKAATFTGTLNSITYAGCASSNFIFGYTSENYGWSFTVIIWLSVFVIGAVISGTVIGKWKKFIKSDS